MFTGEPSGCFGYIILCPTPNVWRKDESVRFAKCVERAISNQNDPECARGKQRKLGVMVY